MTPRSHGRLDIATRVAGIVLLAGAAVLVLGHARHAITHGRPWTWLVAACTTAVLLTAAAPLRRALTFALERPPRWAFLAATAVVAAGVSATLLVLALDGKTMSRDGAVYLMEARALASGALGIEVPEPALGVAARFLLAGPDGRMYGVFPPGWPLAIAPFVLAGAPYAVGPVVAALLVPVQHAMVRVLGGTELAARGAVLVTLVSAARAFETADLLSHAFVALSGCTALVLIADARRPLGWARAVGAGALAGWATSARLLDGVVLGSAIALVLLSGIVSKQRLAKPHHLGLFVLGAAPFAALLFLHQNAATGDWTRPTQHEYFARSDWPPSCHRLGFGKDVGCRVEHPESEVAFGEDGYGPSDALRVTSDRAGRLGDDLFLCAPLLLLAFLAPIVRPSRATLGGAALVMAFTLAYGLFYYGNAPVFGARHLFPIAPIAWALAAIALDGGVRGRAATRTPGAGEGDEGRRDGRGDGGVVGLAVLLAVMAVIAPGHWRGRIAGVAIYRDSLPDVRRALERAGVESAIVLVASGDSLAAAVTPNDRSRGLVLARVPSLAPLMRALYPRLPVVRVHADERVERVTPVAPRLTYPLMCAWPALVRTSRAAVVPADRDRLIVHRAELGATVRIPIWVPRDGRYHVALRGVTTAVSGRWLPRLDGHVGPVLDGYGDRIAPVVVLWPRSIPLRRGYRSLALESVGRDARSGGLLAAFETLDLERDATADR
ncbi:MAG: hypothetical protein IT379_05910 [Deltaproteobacteria bacterium]|nr:hypothetical protein [Deltaproteobacteria bacterium]